VAKQAHSDPNPASTVRTRRAYFDCQFGQLHVRTAFPTTGGFDEGVTLFCLHPSENTSRVFDKFLPHIGDVRSVYAPDLPGCGESDPAPQMDYANAARAVADLAADLRLRQIDVLGFRFGAGVAMELAAVKPDLVRRLVLAAVPPIDRMPSLKQESLVLRVKLGVGDDAQWTKNVLSRAKYLDLTDHAPDMFDAAPATLAKSIGGFLKAA
jgi:pimeloyl-ACP methyl ester carboxylesterase